MRFFTLIVGTLFVAVCTTVIGGCGNSLFDAQLNGDANRDERDGEDGGPGPGQDGSLVEADADPLAPDAGPLGCASLPTAQPGANLGTLGVDSANILHGSCANGLADEDAPEAVYQLTLGAQSDLRLSVTGTTDAPDVIVYLVADCTVGANELICADNPDELEYRDAPAGTYYVVVEGYGADDLGGYRLDVDVVEILPLAASCQPSSTDARCATGLLCADTTLTCQNATSLLNIDFTTNLSPATVTDVADDGITWKFCSSGTGCFSNKTGSASGGGSAIVNAAAFQPTDGEILSTPTVSGAGFSKVVLAFNQYFYHWFACPDAGFIEITTDGTNYTRLDTLLEVHKGYSEYDISSVAAGQNFSVRFVYDDDTVGSDCNAQSWQLDDISIRAL